MSYINLNVATKNSRATVLNTSLGGTAYLMIYSGTQPVAPDVTVSSGTLLAALPCSATPGALTYFVQAASVNNAGSGGTNGAATITGTTGTGTKFQASVTIAGGVLTSINSISVTGPYTVLPTNLTSEPVTAGANPLTGATVSLGLSSIWTANAITTTNASATGTAGWARLAANNTAGGAGIIDMDVGTSGTTATINTTSIASGGPVVVSSITLSEV